MRIQKHFESLLLIEKRNISLICSLSAIQALSLMILPTSVDLTHRNQANKYSCASGEPEG